MDEGLLIHLVEGAPHLYDKSRQDFKNKIKRENTWREISSALNTDMDTVQKSWKNLRDKYVKEKKKMVLHSGDEGSAEEYWVLSKHLQFLDKHIATRRTSGNVGTTIKNPPSSSNFNTMREILTPTQTCSEASNEPGEDEENGPASEEATLSDSQDVLSTVEESTSVHQTPRRQPSGLNKKKRTSSSSVDENLISTLNSMSTFLEKESSQQHSSADMIFGQYVGMQLQTISTSQRKKAKRQIIEILENDEWDKDVL